VSPPYGAGINYYLKTASAAPVTVTVLDQQGTVVRTLAAPGRAGFNRVQWDLRYEPSAELRMRTSPLLPAPHVRLNDQGWRPPAGGGATISILAPPGTYTVKLTAAGREVSAPLVVRKDPHSAGTEADIQAQTRLMFELRRDLNTAVDIVNRLELVRSQLEMLQRVAADADVKKAAAAVAQRATDLEMKCIELRITGAQDGIRYAAKLVSRFGYLANGVSAADFAPTDQQVEVQRLLAERLRGHEKEFQAFLDKDLADFNAMLRARNIANIAGK
jgi:hypothetical protein